MGAWQTAGREGGMESRCVNRKCNRISEADLSTFDPTDFEENAEDEILPDLFGEWSLTSTDVDEDDEDGMLPDLFEDWSLPSSEEDAIVSSQEQLLDPL